MANVRQTLNAEEISRTTAYWAVRIAELYTYEQAVQFVSWRAIRKPSPRQPRRNKPKATAKDGDRQAVSTKLSEVSEESRRKMKNPGSPSNAYQQGGSGLLPACRQSNSLTSVSISYLGRIIQTTRQGEKQQFGKNKEIPMCYNHNSLLPDDAKRKGTCRAVTQVGLLAEEPSAVKSELISQHCDWNVHRLAEAINAKHNVTRQY